MGICGLWENKLYQRLCSDRMTAHVRKCTTPSAGLTEWTTQTCASYTAQEPNLTAGVSVPVGLLHRDQAWTITK